MNETRKNKGPWMHRCLIWLFSIGLAVLLYWLLGFIIKDIGTLRGPSYPDVEKQFLKPELTERLNNITSQIGALQQKIRDQQERQKILRDSTNSSRETMTQLLEFQKINLQKNITPSAEEQQALAKSQSIFLSNQEKYQALNEDIAQRSEELRSLEDQRKGIETELEKQRQPAREEFQRLLRKHNIKIAVFKLLVLIPLLLIALLFFLKQRAGLYVPLIYAAGIALILKVGVVIHEHFPSRYFKYILIGVSIAIVIRILVYLLHMMAFPKMDWLFRQYREAYDKFLCPICGYPIRRGPMKYAPWGRRTFKKQLVPDLSAPAEKDETYTCPACGSKVYEVCESCKATRHSLLPFCEKCGAEKKVG